MGEGVGVFQYTNMANLKNAIKQIRKDKKRTARNMKYRGDLKTLLKKARRAVVVGDKSAAELVKQVQKSIDKMVQKGIMHRNAGARTLSRLTALKSKKK